MGPVYGTVLVVLRLYSDIDFMVNVVTNQPRMFKINIGFLSYILFVQSHVSKIFTSRLK